jgi:hypothetical protein
MYGMSKGAGIFKGLVYKGWNVAFPTLGTNGKYKVTHVNKPEAVHLTDSLGRAKAWVDRQPMVAY